MLASSKLLINQRLQVLLWIGFSSGLPLALTGSTLQAWFTQAHISVVSVGALTLLGIPYTLKFLWAPLMDHFQIPVLGKRRGWIVLMQVLLASSLFALAQMDPGTQSGLMGMVALVVAFFSASQDIAIDAYRTDILQEKERGLGAAYFVFAYRMAMLVTGGLALIFADYLGWKFTYEVMGAVILFSTIPIIFAPLAPDQKMSPNLFLTFKDSITNLFDREKIILILLFIILYKLGDAFALSLMMNFLLKGLGFTLSEVGIAYKVMSIGATIIGCFVGGLLLTRWNIYRALFIFGLAQSLSNLAFVALALVGKNFVFMSFSIFIENFCSGLSTAAFYSQPFR